MAGTSSVGALTSLVGVASGIPTSLSPTPIPSWLDRVQGAQTPIFNAITKARAEDGFKQKKLTWGFSSNRILYDQLNGAYTTTGVTLTVDNQSRFQVGDFIKIESEIFRVTAYVSTTQLTVQFAQLGTSNANHADNSGIQILLPGFLENQSAEITPIMQGEIQTNEWQQAEWMLPSSHARQIFDTYENHGKGDALAYFMKKLSKVEAPLQIERALIANPAGQAGTASVAGAFGGILTPAYTTNRTSVSGALTMKALMDALETAQIASEEPVDLTAIGHPRMLRRLSSMFSGSRMADANEDTITLHYEKFKTPYGMLTFLPSRNWTQPGTVDGTPEKELNQLLICNPKDFELVPAPDSEMEILFRDVPYNDAWQKRAFMRTMISLRAKNPLTRTILYGFSTTDTDYPQMI